jgi:hypothetical protein
MAFTPVSGNSGRIMTRATAGTAVGSAVPIAGLDAWEMVKKTVGIKVYHFEGTLDSDSNLYPSFVLQGTSEANCTFSGSLDTNSTTSTDSGTPGLSNGRTVFMDFVLVKGTPWGFDVVTVFIEQITIGTKIGQEAAKFSGSGIVVGTPGKTVQLT